MALSVLHSAQANGTSQTITSATAGNVLVQFINQSVAVFPPTGHDNISGSTGWTTNATDATYNTTDSIYVCYKTAVGGETTLNPTAGTGATVVGNIYFEIAGGCSLNVDDITTSNHGTSSTTSWTSGLINTTNAGDILLCGVGLGGASGTIKAWTTAGSPPAFTNVGTTTVSQFGGYNVPGTTITSGGADANWTTSQKVGMLLIALEPTATITSHLLTTMGIGS